MNNEQFDRILHSKLADHTVIPPPEVWHSIEKSRSKRKGIIWWMAGLMLLSISGSLYFILPSGETETNSTPAVKVNKQADANIPESNQESSGSVSGSPMLQSGNTLFSPLNSSGKTLNKLQHSGANSFSEAFISADESGVNSAEEFETLFPATIIKLDKIEFDLPVLSTVPVTPKPESKTSNTSNISLLFSAGPVLASKHLESKYGHYGDEKYILYRNESELRNSAWLASMLLQVEVSRHIFIRAGVNYLSISEKIGMRYIKAQVDGVITDTIVGTRNENTDPSQLLSVSEDEDFKLLADYTLRDKTEYRFLSFPVMAGVTFDKSKLSFYASAGLALNFSSNYSGKILAPDSAYLFSIQDVSTSPFNKLTGFTFVSSAGVGYRVTDKLKLLFEPSYFRQLPDFTKTEYRLSQRFSGYGVQAGIIYKL